MVSSILSGPPGTLSVRPFFSGRDYHSLHHENGAFRFEPESSRGCLVWQPYGGVPPIHVIANGEYHHHPDWYRNFRYEAERDPDLDYSEDLAAPGTFTFSLDVREAAVAFSTEPIAARDALAEAGLGHVSEIADGDAPHRPNGCPFQAWSVGEALRLDRIVLAASARGNRRRRSASKGAEGVAHEIGV
jgi:glycogen debranching enzyme